KEALKLGEIHAKMHPNYRYRPRKNKKLAKITKSSNFKKSETHKREVYMHEKDSQNLKWASGSHGHGLKSIDHPASNIRPRSLCDSDLLFSDRSRKLNSKFSKSLFRLSLSPVFKVSKFSCYNDHALLFLQDIEAMNKYYRMHQHGENLPANALGDEVVCQPLKLVDNLVRNQYQEHQNKQLASEAFINLANYSSICPI
ncbi:MAG: hypothetical protein MHPSP_002796, partial [Paramarteilia canceri]